MTGTTWVEESGFLEGPVAITNTHSVGVVRDSMIAWGLQHGALDQAALVVASRRRRNLGRLAERPQRFSCEEGRRLRRPRLRKSGTVAEGNTAVAPAWSATDSKAAPAPLLAFYQKNKGATPSAFSSNATAAADPS